MASGKADQRIQLAITNSNSIFLTKRICDFQE